MLTKDLVRFSLKGKAVQPDFIDPANEALRHLAENLLEVFRQSVGKSRSQLEEESKLIADGGQASGILARGLEKLLFDRVDFETGTDEDLMAWRHRVFLQTSARLSQACYPTVDAFRKAVAEEQEASADEISTRLYSDLPENQPVVRFRSFSAERLLHRYNVALVQWLLLHTHALTVVVPYQDTKAWRQFFRHLRFHQLLANIKKKRGGLIEVTVDGPMSLFQQTKKYGLSLASFFPAVLHFPEWTMRAEVHLRQRKPKSLTLDHHMGLRPYSNHFSAHIPEEVRLFQSLFDEQSSGWTLAPAEDFVALPGDAYGFPDFTFTHASASEKTLALELFHGWHEGPLRHRLQQLESDSSYVESPPLLLGVDRKLTKDEALKAALEASPYFQRWGFLFRDMPSPKPLLKLLNAVEEIDR